MCLVPPFPSPYTCQGSLAGLLLYPLARMSGRMRPGLASLVALFSPCPRSLFFLLPANPSSSLARPSRRLPRKTRRPPRRHLPRRPPLPRRAPRRVRAKKPPRRPRKTASKPPASRWQWSVTGHRRAPLWIRGGGSEGPLRVAPRAGQQCTTNHGNASHHRPIVAAAGFADDKLSMHEPCT